MPDGVYNVVQGEGETGALLSGHQGLDKLSFTGYVSFDIYTFTFIRKIGSVDLHFA